MKLIKLVKYLNSNGCFLLREGSRHSWWINQDKNLRSSVPRHKEISDVLAQKICRDLGIPKIK